MEKGRDLKYLLQKSIAWICMFSIVICSICYIPVRAKSIKNLKLSQKKVTVKVGKTKKIKIK